MKTIEEKANFLRMYMISEICALGSDEKGIWGKMNAQQMVEHLADAFRNYPNLDHQKMKTPEELLPKFREFMLSEKPFRPNTVNQAMEPEPASTRYSTMEESLDDLSNAIEECFAAFDKNPEHIIDNPVFGQLNYEQAVQLLYKHCLHHMTQFRLFE
ncbi:MAG: hypothetical protein JNL47_06255 [Bacteroidia bacterium]|nr:hypothetical protein [Bacteroidia bacterium]